MWGKPNVEGHGPIGDRAYAMRIVSLAGGGGYLIQRREVGGAHWFTFSTRFGGSWNGGWGMEDAHERVRQTHQLPLKKATKWANALAQVHGGLDCPLLEEGEIKEAPGIA